MFVAGIFLEKLQLNCVLFTKLLGQYPAVCSDSTASYASSTVDTLCVKKLSMWNITLRSQVFILLEQHGYILCQAIGATGPNVLKTQENLVFSVQDVLDSGSKKYLCPTVSFSKPGTPFCWTRSSLMIDDAPESTPRWSDSRSQHLPKAWLCAAKWSRFSLQMKPGPHSNNRAKTGDNVSDRASSGLVLQSANTLHLFSISCRDILSFFSFLLLQYLSLKTLPRLESLSGAPVIYHDTTFYLWRTFPNQAYKVVHNL